MTIIKKQDLPTVCINLLTKNRTEYMVPCVKKALDNLKYEGKLVWYISDGGSEKSHRDKVDEIIPREMILGRHSFSVSPGKSWNIGLKEIFKSVDIYLRLEDDYVLKDYLDITVWVKLLMTQTDIGMVRLGQIVKYLDSVTVGYYTYTHVGYTEETYLELGKQKLYTYSGHPCLIHKRLHDEFGYFEEGISPGEVECKFDEVVRKRFIPKIVFPWDMGKYGTWGVWDHIGKEKSE